MNWPVFFLGCFVVGFVLSALSFAFGIVDAHVHFPWETHVHVGGLNHGHMHGLGPINFATITAFVAWFGGAGYLLTTEFRWLALPAIDPGLATFYDRTVKSQLDRTSPFSVWGQDGSLEWLQTIVKAFTVGLALLVGFIPRRRSLGTKSGL